MHWLVPDKIYQRLLATEKDINRSKMAVISQTLAEMTEGQPRDTFEPWGDHFHPQSRDGMGISKDYGPVDLKLRHLVSTPRADPAIKEDTLTQWDYVTRKLFVLKSTPLEKAVPNLGAGAKVILPKLSSPDLPPEQRVDITKPVRHLTNADWANVARAFQSWPFRPENLTQPTVQEQEAKDV
ncbi:Mitochondrial transcription factor 1 [Tulasnella sp. 419]|nr:Mitochondrial transcription factor 1 [Tulasnella sp. 419]